MTTRRRLSTSERRAAILAAAREHFATTDYPEASVPVIAAASGSSQSLVFHYYSSKAGLYASVVEDSLRRLLDARLTAADLHPGHAVRDRVAALLQAHLDALAADHTLLPGPGEPEAALRHRRAADEELAEQLRGIIGAGDLPRHAWALQGWVGFLGHAGRRWVELGCPEDQRWPIIEAALGALEGALGDWAV